ncbi:MAG: NYN domain-containing protein [Desulfonatronovibrio sp.]
MPTLKATYLIDGFNLYHSVKSVQKSLKAPVKWLDIKGLFQSRLQIVRSNTGAKVDLKNIYYFSAYANHLKDSGVVVRHKKYVACLEDSGIKVQMSRFKYKKIYCPFCKATIPRYEEKETDVSIALKLVEVFLKDECDIAVVVSGDTDIAPAVRMAKEIYPNKQIFFDFPANRKNNELGKICPGSVTIKPSQYSKFQFPDPYILQNGTIIAKPSSW